VDTPLAARLPSPNSPADLAVGRHIRVFGGSALVTLLSVRIACAMVLATSIPSVISTNIAGAAADEINSDNPDYRICRVTAYCDSGVTASGRWTRVGQCAAPEDIPFGSRIYIPELDRTFVVTDRTAKRFRKNTIDIFMPNRGDCIEFGCNYLEVEVRLPDEPWTYQRD
jgi:3D (Asp-Asp-Asp) domain-containing protein